MSATIEQPTTASEQQPAPEGPQGEAPAGVTEAARLCTTCAAPLASGQDWCLECGSAQPGRLGGRPGWRAAVSVMGATAVLALGAGAAAYAALQSDANRDASAPPPPAATPVVSTPPAQTAPAPPPPAAGTPTVKAPKTAPADVPQVKAPAAPPAPPAPPAPVGTGGDTSSGGDTGSGATSTDTTKTEPKAETIPLDAGAATTYDPYNRGGELVGDPADAIDGKDGTAWEAPVDAQGNVGLGLALTLDAKHLIKAVKFGADTPGFNVEIYASDAKDLPPDILDARWTHIRNLKDVGVTEKVTIDEKPFRHVLLWITKQPADTKVAIPEVELLK